MNAFNHRQVPFLFRRYPFELKGNGIRESVGYSLIVFLILYLLRPFGIAAYPGNTFLMCAAFMGVTFVICLADTNLLWRPLTTHIKPWRIWHQCATLLAHIFFIGIANFVTYLIYFHAQPSWGAFAMFTWWTLIIGLIVTLVDISVNYFRMLRTQLQKLLPNTTDEQQLVTITLHDNAVRGSDLTLPINDLLYLEAQKNNVIAYYLKGDDIHQQSLHTTLSTVLSDLSEYDNIFQCHRSFAVNLNNLDAASGNSNGYQIRLRGCTAIVPVSRTYVAKLKAKVE